MKSVGIKMLKNNLSRYLDLVRQGEVVFVTDRDEIIAELRAPSQPQLARTSPWVAFLEGQARKGSVQLARRKVSRVQGPGSTPARDAQRLLDEVRQERGG